MNYRNAWLVLLLLLSSCGAKNDLFTSSKYERVYSTTLSQEKHEIIYQLLRDNFADFPENRNKKIIYFKEDPDYVLKILLKRNKFKLRYHSNKGLNDRVESIKLKIESIGAE